MFQLKESQDIWNNKTKRQMITQNAKQQTEYLQKYLTQDTNWKIQNKVILNIFQIRIL